MTLGAAADRDLAESALRRLEPADLPTSELGCRRLGVVLGASPAAADLAARDRWLLHVLDTPTLPDPTEAVAASDAAGLRQAHRRGLFLIAVRDLMGEFDTPRAAEALSDLADAVLQRSHLLARAEMGEPAADLAVMAMGKLGGRELNYVSDVDVIFVHRGEQQAAVKLAQRVLDLAGSCVEMDANLRPEGRSGALSRTVESYLEYHQRWGRTWEVQALVKMRHAAGPAELGTQLHAALEPLIWPGSRAPDTVADVQQMKGEVERSRPVRRDGIRQLKLAPGGLRDIEFAVQLLQLVHGPTDVSLRAAGTLPALQALARGGYVDEGDAQLFGDAYRFLRTVEHRLQLWGLRRTHTIPAADAERHRLAIVLGFRDLPARSALEEFDRELERVRRGVRRLHEKLFFRPLLGTVAAWASSDRLDGGLDRSAAKKRLEALGFVAPSRALGDVEALANGTTRTARQLRVALPAMLEALATGPDPDAGLRAVRDVADALAGRPGFLRLIRDNPSHAAVLARVLATSPRLARWFVHQPEALRLLTDRVALRVDPSTEEEVRTAIAVVGRGGGTGGLDALRRHARRTLLRTALRVVLGDADVHQAGREMSDLGEGLLAGALHAADNRFGDGARLGILAMGRFGGRELGFPSDLDVVFVHEGDAAVADRKAGAVIEMLGSTAPVAGTFDVDAGLRPEGRAGPLTRSVASTLRYYQEWAKPWELFALTQARPAGGETELVAELLEGVTDQVYRTDATRVRAVRRMKARLESERVRSREDLKLGPGGLADIEWTVQLLRMVHGRDAVDLRSPGTARGISLLHEHGWLSDTESEWLADGWQLFSEVRNGVFLLGERRTDQLPVAPERRAQLAALLGVDGLQALEESVARARRRVRRVMEQRFYD